MKHFSDLTEQELLARPEELEAQYVPAEVEKTEGESERRFFFCRRFFLLQIVQPGLAGLMGRFGLDPGAALRRRLCDAADLADLSGLTFLGRPFWLALRLWSALRPRSAPGSRWGSPKHFPTTARRPGASALGPAASSAAQ
jgi:hypothetical protein